MCDPPCKNCAHYYNDNENDNENDNGNGNYNEYVKYNENYKVQLIREGC